MLLDTAMIDEEYVLYNNCDPNILLNIRTPAFRRIHEKSYQKTTGYLVCHHKLIDLFKKLDKKDIQTHFKMNAFEVPMLVPPRPWTYITEGGYLALSCELEYIFFNYVQTINFFLAQIARCASDSYQYHLLLHNSDNMKPVFDSLNYLSSCPWSVNTRVSGFRSFQMTNEVSQLSENTVFILIFFVQILDIVIDLFNKNDLSLLEQPSQDVPELPSVPMYVSHKLHVRCLRGGCLMSRDCDDFEIKMQVKRIKKEIKKLRNESFSLKMTLLYRLSLANFVSLGITSSLDFTV